MEMKGKLGFFYIFIYLHKLFQLLLKVKLMGSSFDHY
jgi:hypothetical protein